MSLHKQRLTTDRRWESIRKWRNIMNISRQWNFKSIAGRIVLGLVLALMIGSIYATPVLAKNDHRSQGKHDNDRYENRGRGHYQDRYGKRGYYYSHGKRVYRPRAYYGPRERIYYPPPPVVYAPPPPPGIRIFFPPVFIHP